MKTLKRSMFVIALVAMFLLGACSTAVVSADQTNPLKIWFQNENGVYRTLLLVDDATGVNYIVVATDDVNGGDAPAITPRLNADGSLYVTP